MFMHEKEWFEEMSPRDARTARGVLDIVIDYLNQGSRGAAAVWAILTSLRGPDDGNVCVKEITTARVRAVVGLKQALDLYPYFPSTKQNPVPEEFRVLRAKMAFQDGYEHFMSHFDDAVRALRALYGWDLDHEQACPTEFPQYSYMESVCADKDYICPANTQPKQPIAKEQKS